MDSYRIQGDYYYHQGYASQIAPPGTTPAQSPPPGTAPPQAPPPGTVPAQPLVNASASLAPPGVAPTPSPAPPPYYGTYPTPSYGYVPSSADQWSSYPMPAAEPHPYPSYPPTVSYDRPSYGHIPYHQDPFPPYHHRYAAAPPPPPPPPHAFLPLPPRGSDVTRYRKKRPFLAQPNLRPKNKPFKQPPPNPRGVNKRGFIADPRAFNVALHGNLMVNNAQYLHPGLWQTRGNEVPVNRPGKKRRMEERGRARKDDRRKGEKGSRPSWKKGKRKKNKRSGRERRSMDPISDVKGVDSEKGEPVPMTDEEMREAEVWSELHRDARRSVQEFLHTLMEKETNVKMHAQDTVGDGGDGSAQIEENDNVVDPDCIVADHVEASEPDHVDVSGADCRGALQSNHMNAGGTDVLSSEVVQGADLNALHSDCVNSSESTVQPDGVDLSMSIGQEAPEQKLENGVKSELAGVDNSKEEFDNQKPLLKSRRNDRSQEVPSEEELKEREERSFEFFTKLWEENKVLRTKYIEKYDNGSFECLMCHSKLKKRFTNLGSLVTHATNVLRTKKLPEHRGYGRAICALLGWDPYRMPKGSKTKSSRLGIDIARGDDEIALAKESVPKDDAVIDIAAGGDVDSSVLTVNADGSVEQVTIEDVEKPVDDDGIERLNEDGRDIVKDVQKPVDDKEIERLNEDGLGVNAPNQEAMVQEDATKVNAEAVDAIIVSVEAVEAIIMNAEAEDAPMVSVDVNTHEEDVAGGNGQAERVEVMVDAELFGVQN